MTRNPADLKQQLTARAREHNGIPIDLEDEGLLFFDRFARHGYFSRIPDDQNPHEEQRLLKALSDFLQKTSKVECKPRLQLTVEVLIESLQSRSAREALTHLARGALFAACAVRIVLNICQPPDDWSLLLDWFAELREAAHGWDKHREQNLPKLGLAVCGPLGNVDERLKESAVEWNLRLFCTFGWWKDCSPDAYTNTASDALSELAAYGLQVPAVWYVHQQNIERIPSLLPESLEANLHGGLALPLVCRNPYYSFAEGQPAPADSESYKKLLVETCESHPHYDSQFVPLIELARNLAQGGWNSDLSVPPHMRILLAPDAGLRVFRHFPAFAQLWMSADVLLDMEPSDILPGLIRFHAREYVPDKLPGCADCDWRYVCGGADVAGGDTPGLPGQLFAVNCEYRILFLRAFSFARNTLSAEETLRRQANASRRSRKRVMGR